ncbi:hypothetical protein HOY82DRAFT_539473 [Tuber indicum]|nr:hypothetical protein HOY82DRAFT_539473 [Tuber indicum]
MAPSSPQSWRQRRITENIVNCAEREMIENNFKEQRIHSLETQIHDMKQKKKTRRKLIPDHGTRFLSRNDIVDFFAHREAEKHQKLQGVIARRRQRIVGIETKINSLLVKRRKAEELEEGGHLPKRWKTSFQLSEEISLFEKRIGKARDELRSAENLETESSEDSEGDETRAPIFPQSEELLTLGV